MENADEYIDLSCGFNDDDYVFEQGKDGYIFWDKKENKQVDRPREYSSYQPLADCPWKIASTLEEYGDKGKLWVEVKQFILAHVFLSDERLYDVLTAWVFANWIPEKWNVIPYLSIKGPINSGKTRLLETLEAVSYRGIFSANMTSSALFRLCELFKPTIFLDETEIYTKDAYSDVLHLVNAGYRRGQKAWRVENKDGVMFVKGYDVFGFKAFSGTKELTSAVHSRSIIIDMVRNPNRLSFGITEKKGQELRNKLLKWRFTTLSDPLTKSADDFDDFDDFSGDTPPSLKELADLNDGRLLELFYSLLHVANEGTENIVSYAKGMFEDRQSEEQTTLQFQIMEGLVKCVDFVERNKIMCKKVKEVVNEGLEEKEGFTTSYVTKILGELGFKKVHMEKGIGIIWNERMVENRVRQYRIGGYTPPKTSKTSKTSAVDSKLDLVIGTEVKPVVQEVPSEPSATILSVSDRLCGDCLFIGTGACEYPTGPDAVKPETVWAVSCLGFKSKESVEEHEGDVGTS
jgi:hypothetical protein